MDPWSTLIDAGLKFIETFTAPPAPNDTNRTNGNTTGRMSAWVEDDPATGKPCLKVPLPEPATLNKLAEGLSQLLSGLRR
jgi:hypothetical protein